MNTSQVLRGYNGPSTALRLNVRRVKTGGCLGRNGRARCNVFRRPSGVNVRTSRPGDNCPAKGSGLNRQIPIWPA